MSTQPKSTLSRREAIHGILLTVSALPLAACSPATLASVDGGDAASNPTTDGGAPDDASVDASPDASPDADGSSAKWASGGTKSMSGNYGDPFATPVTTCVLAKRATEGPCTEAADRVRKDISEGFTGLPMRLALRVVDEACKPIAGAKVKVWQTHIAGGYSGDTPNNDGCLQKPSDAKVHCFRGVQTTDEKGRVDFDSCFPGWYPGRAIHIHYTVSIGNAAYTSQLAFDQALVDEIFQTHPEYTGFGKPDTSNAADSFVGGAGLASFVMDTSRMNDGALLAAKQLVVRLT